MKFKTDENLPLEAAEILRQSGNDAQSVYEEGLAGASDPSVLKACVLEDRILVTLDLDFGNIAQYPPHQYPGFIVLRPHRQDKRTVLDFVARIVILLETEPLDHRLWIVEPGRVRIHDTEGGSGS